MTESSNDLWAEIESLQAEIIAWAKGEKSFNNTFMAVEGSPEDRQDTLIAIEEADAAHVAKLKNAVEGLVIIATGLADD